MPCPVKHGLEPLLCPNARVLILGSLPGDESLRQQRYYAHPQNQFWRIIAAAHDVAAFDSYDAQIAFLKTKYIAVWDVLAAAERTGSLDTAIKKPVPNEFGPLLQRHSTLQAITFNGQKAAALFKRHIAPQLTAALNGLNATVLPSTSPAAAMLSFDQKVSQWRVFLSDASRPSTPGR